MSEQESMEQEIDSWVGAVDNGGSVDIEATPEESDVEVIEEVIEETVDEDGNVIEEESVDEAEDTLEADAPADDKPRSKMIPRERMDEIIEQRNQRDADLAAERQKTQHLDFQLQQQTDALNKLMAKLSGEEDSADADEGSEVLDEVLEKKVDSKFDAIEERDFQRTKQQEAAYLGESGGEVLEKAVAAIAIEVMQNEQSYGRPMNDTQAEQTARQIIDKQMRNMYKENAQPGAIAQALNKKAQYFDYLVSQPTQKTAGQKRKNGVDMKAVDKARTTAGAPTIDKEAVTMQPNNIVDKEVKKARDSGVSDEMLEKFGF